MRKPGLSEVLLSKISLGTRLSEEAVLNSHVLKLEGSWCNIHRAQSRGQACERIDSMDIDRVTCCARHGTSQTCAMSIPSTYSVVSKSASTLEMDAVDFIAVKRPNQSIGDGSSARKPIDCDEEGPRR